MAFIFQYPRFKAEEVAFWAVFRSAEYSVINSKRTRGSVSSRADLEIWLPFTSEPKMSLQHEFAQGTNPVGPVLSLAGLKNTSGGDEAFLERLSAPAAAFYEATFTTDTYRRFSNVTEATMTSEARRNFSFKYLFVPKTEQEALEVDNITIGFKNFSYPKVVSGLPERTYPQNLWTIQAQSAVAASNQLTVSWLGDPLVCVLSSMHIEKGDPNDPVVKVLPNTRAAATLMTLTFTEFETGTYASTAGFGGSLLSKSEVSNLGNIL